MTEYIEREALLCMVRPDDPSDEKAAITIATAKKLIRSLAYRCPASDVAKVRNGRWVKIYENGEPAIEQHQLGVFCSRCKKMPKDRFTESDFCPNCGAKMDL